MNEYSFENVVIDPNSKEAKSNLNKEVYIGFGVASLLKNANSDSEKATLVSINPNSDNPFVVRKNGETDEVSCSAIITCKEMEMVLCSEPFYIWDELLDRASKLANEYGKDCIKQVLIQKTGYIFKRETYILLFWRKVEKRS